MVPSFVNPAPPGERDPRAFVAAVLLVGLLAGGCNGTPAEPGPTPVPTPTGLTVSCPADQSATAVGPTEAVLFPQPVATGGTPPVTVECLPARGSAFPVGTSNVTCTARDGLARTSSCAFRVSVRAAPRLTVTRFLAVGDSITYGVLQPACVGSTASVQPAPLALLTDRELIVAAADVPSSYPTKLQTLLRQQYSAQSPVVVNEGVPGETTTEATERFLTLLTRHQPEVLLLQEGANNVNNSMDPASIAIVIRDLRWMILTARGRGVEVFLGTLLPQRAGACRAFAPTLIDPANAGIRALAASEGVPLVDLHAAFAGQLTTLLGTDGLHPTETGYQRMADTFLAVIRAKFER